MTMIFQVSNRHCDMVLDALQAEFGAVAARRIVEAEAADFLWEARVRERYLGQHFDVWMSEEAAEIELARIAVLSLLGGRWHVAACLVDGDGMAIDLLWKNDFDSFDDAEMAFVRAN